MLDKQGGRSGASVVENKRKVGCDFMVDGIHVEWECENGGVVCDKSQRNTEEFGMFRAESGLKNERDGGEEVVIRTGGEDGLEMGDRTWYLSVAF